MSRREQYRQWARGARAGVHDVAVAPAAFLRGARWANGLPAPTVPAHPTERAPGPLETYFDQHTVGPGLWKWRHYFDIYERHLGKFVGQDAHLVEVGIFSGGSLPMWRSYLGDGVHIHGVDIEPACRAYAGEGIDVHIGDQSDPQFWAGFREAVPHVDILIDDGGHEAHQQIETLEAMLAHIAPGGVYLCEDIHGASQPFHSYVDGVERLMHRMSAEPSAAQQHIGSVHRYPFVTVIEKPLLPVAPLESPRHGTEWEPFL